VARGVQSSLVFIAHPIARIAEALFDFLNVGQPASPADLIFVFAGREQRKRFGITLWQHGLAPELLLSVGRFEWRRFDQLGLTSDGGLRSLVAATRPQDRHFFLRCTNSNCAASKMMPKGFLGTLSEARALKNILRDESIRSVLVVSTSWHLRRSVLALRRALDGRSIAIRAVAVPEHSSDFRREQLRQSWHACGAVFEEFAKYLLYVMFS
jgi:hypothetical protein